MKTGVLLINLGTPNSPSISDVHKYLTQFLNDPFVIDIFWLKRLLLVNLIIVPFRAPKTAKLYQKIWTAEGSPLLVNGIALKDKIQEKLGSEYVVELAMRYQNPSLKYGLEKLVKKDVSRIIALPLYPHFASSTTLSTTKKIDKLKIKMNGIPNIVHIGQFYDHPLFIKSWVNQISKHNLESYDHLLFSFHGLPERHLAKEHVSGDCEQDHCTTEINKANKTCYKATCYATVRLIASAMNLKEEYYTVCFQSRLGKDPWIQPSSDHVVIEQAKKGAKKLLVASPSFIADCLETVYEIAIEYKQLFLENGGEELHLIESLNTSPVWLDAVESLVKFK